MSKPLDGVRVIDLSAFAAAASCGRILGEWGADVIKIEPIGGEAGRYAGATLGLPSVPGANPSFECNNAYKRGLALNLKSASGMEVIHRLLQVSDVFLTNNRTRALEKLGLDYTSIHKKYPHIIWAQITGFGDKGPAADDAGFDPVAFWARSGAMLDVAEKNTVPVLPPTGFGDRTTACSLAAGICAALYRKGRTGEGQKVTVSLFGQALWNAGEVVQSCQYGDQYPKSRKEPVTPLVNSYQCSDEQWIFVSCYDYNRYIRVFCELIGRPELADDHRFSTVKAAKENCASLVSFLEDGFRRYDRERWTVLLKEKDIPFSQVKHFADAVNDEQAIANGYVFPYSHRDGSTTVGTAVPAVFSEDSQTTYRNAPLLGEHSLEILKDLDFGSDEIDAMLQAKDIVVTKY